MTDTHHHARGPARAIADRVLRIARWMKRRILRLFIARRLFNPWFHTPEGIEFVCDLLLRLNQGSRFSRATRKAIHRFYITQPLFIIPPKRWLFKKREGLLPISLLALSPTKKCNLNCDGCFGGGCADGELSFETVSRVVVEANRMGLYMFALIGGEPLCWEPLFDLVEKHKESNFGIYTNGTLVTERIAHRLARLGNANFDFSVEGFEQETDERRGAGVFRKVIDAMAMCKAAGVRFGYSVTVTRRNNELLVSDEFVDYFIQRGCFDGWYYQYMPVGLKPDMSLIPTPEQRDYRRRRFDELRKTKEINLFDFVNDGPLVGGCICGGRLYVHITADGDVEPCAFYPFAVDNIHDKSLADVLKSPFFQRIRERQNRTDNLLAPCPIIDHPHWLRDVVSLSNAHPDQPSARRLFDDLKVPLDRYGEAYGKLSGEVWKAGKQ